MREVNAYCASLNLSQIWAVTEWLRETDPELERLTIRLHPAQSSELKLLRLLCWSGEDRAWLRQQDREVQKAVGKWLAQMYDCFTHKARFKIDSSMPKDEIEFWHIGADPGDILHIAGRIYGLAIPIGFYP